MPDDALPVDLPQALAGLRAAFEAYEAALMANDQDALAALFWDHASVIRFGPGLTLKGPGEIAAFRAGRDTSDLARTLTRVELTTHGADFGTAWAEYRRTGSGRTGRQSQTWVRRGGVWRIVAAHVSLDPIEPRGM